MIVGLGIDIVETQKIAVSIRRKAFLRKVFTDSEISECSRTGHKAEGYSGKFVLKEAFMKALGAGMRQGVRFSAVEVLKESTGYPLIKVSGRAATIMNSLGVTAIHSSLSWRDGTAVGIVILENSGRPLKK